jgi:hypothetical protein
MEGARSYSGHHFKDYAFIWKAEFNQRQEHIYKRENSHLLPEAEPPNTTQDIVEEFINNGCDDVDAYLSRAALVSGFIATASIDTLSGLSDQAVSEPKVLIDDRNNENVTRLHSAGNCRPFRGPINAHQLYAELCQEVCLQIVPYTSKHIAAPAPPTTV